MALPKSSMLARELLIFGLILFRAEGVLDAEGDDSCEPSAFSFSISHSTNDRDRLRFLPTFLVDMHPLS